MLFFLPLLDSTQIGMKGRRERERGRHEAKGHRSDQNLGGCSGTYSIPGDLPGRPHPKNFYKNGLFLSINGNQTRCLTETWGLIYQPCVEKVLNSVLRMKLRMCVSTKKSVIIKRADTGRTHTSKKSVMINPTCS